MFTAAWLDRNSPCLCSSQQSTRKQRTLEMRWAFLLPFEQSFNSFPGRIFSRHQTTPQSSTPTPTPTPRRSRHQQYGPCSTLKAVTSRCRCGAHCVINKDCAPKQFVQKISKEYHRLKLRQRPASPVPGVPSSSLDDFAGAGPSCDTARQFRWSVSRPSVHGEEILRPHTHTWDMMG